MGRLREAKAAETIPDSSILRALRSHRLALPLGLLAAVAAVLLHGSLTRTTAPPAPSVSPPPPPVAGPALRPDLEKTPLSYLSDYWFQLGRRAGAGLALVGSPRTPAITVAPGLALTWIGASDELGSAGPESESPGAARLLAADDELGLALFAVEAAAAPRRFEPSDPAAWHPGTLVAAVTISEDAGLEVAPGHMLSAPADGGSDAPGDTLELSITLPRRTRFAVIVDLDGRLVGAAVAGRSGAVFLTAAALERGAAQLRANPVCRSIDVALPSDAVRALLGVEAGVVVERVRPSSFEREPPLRPGDLLLEWEGSRLSDPGQFRALYDAGAPSSEVRVVARRGTRRVAGRLRLPARDCRPAGEQPRGLVGAGLELRWRAGEEGESPPGFVVLTVAEGSPAAAAGVTRGDRLVAIDGRFGAEAVRRALEDYERRPRPLLLTVGRGERMRLLALPAPGE